MQSSRKSVNSIFPKQHNMSNSQSEINCSRRRLLQGMACAVPSLLMMKPETVFATVSEKRSLTFRHTHTNEKLSVDYFADHRYLTEALQKVNYFLRDFRTGDKYPMDPQLLDILYSVQQTTGSHGTFEIISGYRSPATNEKLRSKSSGVAKRSLHMQGKAVDIRLTDVSVEAIRRAAIGLKAGGVGIYRRSNFVHLDTGRFRTW